MMADQPLQPGTARVGSFASMLRHHRVQNGLSLATLADRVGCAKSYLSSIENGHKGPPADALIEKLEQALSFQSGELFECAQWDQTPMPIRESLEQLREREESVARLARCLAMGTKSKHSLDGLYESGELRRLIDQIDPDHAQSADNPKDRRTHERTHDQTHGQSDDQADEQPPRALGMLPMEVPLINKVTAGYPADFTDMGYPARIADEYVRAPDLSDPDAFAARVVGDSMEPNYREGDIVVFSPAREIQDGMDCFVRLERDDESTFKRIYFQKDESGGELIRIQPINNSYPPMTVPREAVAGLYAGVSVTRSIG